MERRYHTAWTPTSLPNSIVLLGGWGSATRLTAETVPGFKSKKGNILLHIHIHAGGGSFELKRSGKYACGIPDGGDNSIVLTGGGSPAHKYVTRWVDGKNIITMCNNSDDDHDFDNDNENEYFNINVKMLIMNIIVIMIQFKGHILEVRR